jgi:1-acyl-sn-glycerol-3-phosphate acyltransferase
MGRDAELRPKRRLGTPLLHRWLRFLIFVLLAVLKNVLVRPLMTNVFHPVTEGAQHVPDKDAAIIASNHLSFADWLFMPLALDRRQPLSPNPTTSPSVLIRGCR